MTAGAWCESRIFSKVVVVALIVSGSAMLLLSVFLETMPPMTPLSVHCTTWPGHESTIAFTFTQVRLLLLIASVYLELPSMHTPFHPSSSKKEVLDNL